MKNLYTLIACFALALIGFAQAPQKMNYQAVVRNSANELVTSSQIGMRISVLQGSENGTAVYVETQNPITNQNGLATIEIGTGTVVAGNFSTINWGSGTYFIKTETDPEGGSNYNIWGTSQMLSVPYALYAASAGGGNAGTPGENVGDIQYWTGNQWVNLPAGGIGKVLIIGENGLPKWDGKELMVLDTGPANPWVNESGYDYTKAFIGMTVLFDGGRPVYSTSINNTIGICYATSPSPTIDDQKVQLGPSQTTATLTGLIPGQVYYARSYGINTAGVTYGNEVTWTQWTPGVPTVTINPITNVTSGSATLHGGVVQNNNGSAVTASGICYGTTPNPTTANLVAPGLSYPWPNTYVISQLQSGTTYYVRAFATNSAGTGYSAQVSFTTSSLLEPGALYQGGVIAYVFQLGDPGYIAGETHGIIAAPADNATSIAWGCPSTMISGTSDALGSGANNTAWIIAGCPGEHAAKLCNDLVINGYDDWVLPSLNDFLKMCDNKSLIGGFNTNWQADQSDYWTSTQFVHWANGPLAGSANFVEAYACYTTYLSKSSNIRVRAIRYF